nr:PREDICTED: protein CASC3 [Bemisia tabaci]
MASQGDAATEPESEQITDSDTGAKESDFNDTLDSKYDSMASGSEKAEKSSEVDNESEYESVDEDLVIPKKEPEVEKPKVEEKKIETEKVEEKVEEEKVEKPKIEKEETESKKVDADTAGSEAPASEASQQHESEDPLQSVDTKSESSFISEREDGELSMSDDDLSDVHIEEEREEGDGEEESLSGKDKKLDDDEDRRNPQYIPKKGTFYEHDDRMEDGPEETVNEKEAESEKDAKEEEKIRSKKEAALASKWQHDLYDDKEQAPKSTQELIDTYGYDIRNEEAPPKARRHRRYGRGPNKYTRNWEDENAYVKAGAPRGGRVNRGRGGGGRGGGTFFADNENFNLEKEFPELKNKRNIKSSSETGDNSPPKGSSVIKNSVFYSRATSQQQSAPPREQDDSYRKQQNAPQQVSKPQAEIKIDPAAISGKLHTSRNPPPPAFPPRSKTQAPKYSSTSQHEPQVNGSGNKHFDEKNMAKPAVRGPSQPSVPMTPMDFPRGRAKKIVTETAYAYQQPVGIQHQVENHSEPTEEELSKNFTHLQIEPAQHFNTSAASPTTVPMGHAIDNHGIQDVNSQKLQQSQVAASASSRGKRYSTQRQRSLPESGISFSPPPAAFQQPPQTHYYQPQTYGTQPHQNVYTPKTAAAAPVLTQQPAAQSPPMQLVYLQPPTQPPPPAQYQAPPPPLINYVPQPFTNPAAAYQQLTLPPPPPQPELYQQPSGITYYSAQTQAVLPRQTPPRRIKAAIPIVPPPESNRGNRSNSQMDEEKNAREYYNQEALESSAG